MDVGKRARGLTQKKLRPRLTQIEQKGEGEAISGPLHTRVAEGGGGRENVRVLSNGRKPFK